MATLVMAQERAKARQDKKIDGFTGEIRDVDFTGFTEGTVFTIPENPEVYQSASFGQYIFCPIENSEEVIQFFPSSFLKNRTPYNEDGTIQGSRVFAGGTAVKKYREHASVAAGMAALAGKKIKVSKVDNVRTKRYNGNDLVTTQIPTFDIVEE